MTHAIPAAGAVDETPRGSERGLHEPEAASSAGSRRWLLARSARVLVVLALGVAVVHFVVLLADYGNVFVHPDFHQANLGFVMRSGLAIGLHDFVDILQQREVNEFRPRWLMFYLETLDHKIRMQLYRWIPVYPTLGPVTWLLQLVVTPFLLYKLLMRLTADRLAAVAAVAVYVSSNGFLSGFTMALMPGKTLSNLVTIAAFYAALVAAQRLRPGQFLIESSGQAKHLLALILTLGLFLDELPVAVFFMVPVLFWRYFLPTSLSGRQVALFVSNGLLLGAPVLVFLLLVLVVVPPITEQLLGYRFNYLSEIFYLEGNTRTGTSWLVGPKGSLTPALVFENVTTLFGLSLAPRFISPLVQMPWGEYPGSQVTNLPKLAIFLVFFGTALAIARHAAGQFGMYFRGLLIAIALFLLFLCVLSIRHIPVVTGFYYGASFAALFAILVGMMVKGVSSLWPRAYPLAALAVLGIVGTQIVNFWPINDGWRHAHDEVMLPMRVGELRPGVRRRFPLVSGRALSATEVEGIWAAWKRDRMDRYVRDNGLSPGAAYLVFELREIDRQLRRLRPEDQDE